MADSIEARVARGAALLDEHEPNWFRRIDVGTLDLSHGCLCVLGQVWEEANDSESLMWTGYDEGKKVLGLGWADARDHGFASDECSADVLVAYGNLDEAWIAVIKDRWERLA